MALEDTERRLAAILSADVVGYSRLMDADEESTVQSLRACRAIIDRLVADHRGRVFGSAGGSVVAEFAIPVEAVRCAVDIQRDLEARNQELSENLRMRLRIGIQRLYGRAVRLRPATCLALSGASRIRRHHLRGTLL